MYNVLNGKINELSGLLNNVEQNPEQIPGLSGNIPSEDETTRLGQPRLHTIIISGLEPYQIDLETSELNGTYILYDQTVQFALTNPTKCIYQNSQIGGYLIYQGNNWCIYFDAVGEYFVGTTTCPDNLSTGTYIAYYDTQQTCNFNLTAISNNIPPFPILQKIIITNNDTPLTDLNGEYIITEFTKNNWAYNQREYSNGIYTIKYSDEQNGENYYILSLYKNNEFIGYFGPYNYIDSGNNTLYIDQNFNVVLDLVYKNYNQ